MERSFAPYFWRLRRDGVELPALRKALRASPVCPREGISYPSRWVPACPPCGAAPCGSGMGVPRNLTRHGFPVTGPSGISGNLLGIPSTRAVGPRKWGPPLGPTAIENRGLERDAAGESPPFLPGASEKSLRPGGGAAQPAVNKLCSSAKLGAQGWFVAEPPPGKPHYADEPRGKCLVLCATGNLRIANTPVAQAAPGPFRRVPARPRARHGRHAARLRKLETL